MDKIEEKLDLILKHQEDIIKNQKDLAKNVKLALKAMHLIPATEAEIKKLQLLQRDNLLKAAKVNDDLEAISNANAEKDKDGLKDLLGNSYSMADVYGDILGDDFLGGGE